MKKEGDKIAEFFKDELYNQNKGTVKNYRYHIQKFFNVINKDMNTYFKDAPAYNPTDPEKYNLYYETDLRTYWEYLQHKAPKTKQCSLAAIKMFLKHYDKHTVTLDIWQTIATRLKGTLKPISEEHVPERDEVKRVLEYCDIKTKTAILMGLSSGARIGEIMRLEPRDVHLNETPTRINIRAEIAKNGQRRTTFISSEATELLNEWLRVRNDYIQDAYKSLNFKNAQHVKTRQDKRIFPVSNAVIQRSFNDAAEMAGFKDTTTYKGDDGDRKRQRKTLHFHNLRKYFRSNFGDVDLAEHLMGHSGYLSEYRNFSDKRLAEEYLTHQHNVMVTGEIPETFRQMQADAVEKSQTIQQMKGEIQELKMQLLELRIARQEQINGKK